MVIEKGYAPFSSLVICYSDGAIKRANAVSGFLAQTSSNEVLTTKCTVLDEKTLDSNIPELEALLMAVEFCAQEKIKNAVFYCDSYQAVQFLIKEFHNIRKYPQTQSLLKLLSIFDYYRIQNIARTKNAADALCQKALQALNIK